MNTINNKWLAICTGENTDSQYAGNMNSESGNDLTKCLLLDEGVFTDQ